MCHTVDIMLFRLFLLAITLLAGSTLWTMMQQTAAPSEVLNKFMHDPSMSNSDGVLSIYDKLDERFHPPENWTVTQEDLRSHRMIRYAYYVPDEREATFVLIPGNQEPFEKFYEFIRDLQPQENKRAIYTYDPFGQGGSGRYAEAPANIMHSLGFEEDIKDLEVFLEQIVFPSHPPNKPLFVMAHSKAGHFLTRYLAENQSHKITAAIITTPMYDIETGVIPPVVAKFLANTADILGFSGAQVPDIGGKAIETLLGENDILSSDPERRVVRAKWMAHDPNLAMTGLSFGFLKHTFESIELATPFYISGIRAPMLVVIAENDQVVSNQAISDAISVMPEAESIVIRNAQHDVWMEADPMRAQFMQAVRTFVAKHSSATTDGSTPKSATPERVTITP